MADAPSQLSRLDRLLDQLDRLPVDVRVSDGHRTVEVPSSVFDEAVEVIRSLTASETPRRSFSDFIRNATPEEKEAVYAEVMEKATERQLRATPKTDELEYRSEHGPDKLDGWWWFAQAISLARELERSVTQSATALDGNDEPLREMCIDYRGAHPLHAEGCFQRIVQWVKGNPNATESTVIPPAASTRKA